MTETIAILGGKGAGKSTAAAYLATKYGAKTYALADPLKVLLQRTQNIPPEVLWGSQAQKEAVIERLGMSARDLMTREGDALRAVFGDGLLVEHALREIARAPPALAVISDVRRLDEAAAVRATGAKLWRLHYAPGLRRWPITHVTEAEWMQPAVDLEITPGAGGVAELYASIDEACRLFNIDPISEVRVSSDKHAVGL